MCRWHPFNRRMNYAIGRHPVIGFSSVFVLWFHCSTDWQVRLCNAAACKYFRFRNNEFEQIELTWNGWAVSYHVECDMHLAVDCVARQPATHCDNTSTSHTSDFFVAQFYKQSKQANTKYHTCLAIRSHQSCFANLWRTLNGDEWWMAMAIGTLN